MVQKYRLKHKKHMMAFEDKDGTSSERVQHRYEIEMEEHPPMTSHIDEVRSTMDRNQLDMLISQQQGAPAAIKNTLDFQNLQLSVEANSSTIEEGSAINCGNPVNTLNFESNELTGTWILATHRSKMISSISYPALMLFRGVFLEILVSTCIMILFFRVLMKIVVLKVEVIVISPPMRGARLEYLIILVGKNFLMTLTTSELLMN